LNASTPETAKIITAYGSEKFQNDHSFLVKLLKDNLIRDDVHVLKFQSYPEEQKRFAAGDISTEAEVKIF